jgi:hypothetical protein
LDAENKMPPERAIVPAVCFCGAVNFQSGRPFFILRVTGGWGIKH